MKKLLLALVGVLAFLYLANPTFGVFELLPDNLPFVGNIDEATATMVLLNVLRYLGRYLTDMIVKSDAIEFGK